MRPIRFDQIPRDEPRLREGARLFNAGRYFESHEAWESLWHEVGGRERELLQGLIQLAAAYHHLTQQNSAGARYLYEKARTHLGAWGRRYAGILLGELLRQVERDFAHAKPGSSLGSKPSIRFEP